jgi:hypothetical protein
MTGRQLPSQVERTMIALCHRVSACLWDSTTLYCHKANPARVSAFRSWTGFEKDTAGEWIGAIEAESAFGL